MSRHGRHGRHQNQGQTGRPRPAAQAPERSTSPVEPRPPVVTGTAASNAPVSAVVPAPPLAAMPASDPVAGLAPRLGSGIPAEPVRGPVSAQAIPTRTDNEPPRPTCTVAQLRRFIKSRPWIPMHELRRRFGIYGADDDVSPIRVGEHTLFVGLPLAESRLMAELLGGGDVGYELSLDPRTPVVVGVYPMRPVPRG